MNHAVAGLDWREITGTRLIKADRVFKGLCPYCEHRLAEYRYRREPTTSGEALDWQPGSELMLTLEPGFALVGDVWLRIKTAHEKYGMRGRNYNRLRDRTKTGFYAKQERPDRQLPHAQRTPVDTEREYLVQCPGRRGPCNALLRLTIPSLPDTPA